MKVVIGSQSSAKYNITQDNNVIKVVQSKGTTQNITQSSSVIKVIQSKGHIQKIVNTEQITVKIVSGYGNITIDRIDGGVL